MAETTIIGRIAIKVLPDTSDFKRDLERKLERVERDVEVKVPVELDEKGINQEFDRLHANLERAGDPIKVEVELGNEAAQAAAEKMHDKLERILGDVVVDVDLDDKSKKINVEVDDDDVEDANRHIKQLLRNLDRASKAHPELKLDDLFDSEHADEAIRDLSRLEHATNDLGNAEKRLQSINEKLMRDYGTTLEDAFGAFDEAEMDALRLAKTTEKLERETNRAADEAQRLQHNIDKIKFDDEFERQLVRNAELLQEVDDLSDKMTDIENIDISVDVFGMTEAERKLDRLQRQMDSLRADLTPELTEEQRRKIIHQMADLADQIEDQLDNIEAQIEPSVSELMYRRAQERLAWLSRTRIVSLVPKVNRAAASAAATALAALSGARLGGDIVDDLWSMFKNLDKNLPKIFALGEGIAGVAGWALSASSNLFALSSSLAQIGPAALALPGIFGAMAIGLGVTIMGFKDFNKVLPEVSKRWTALQDVVSTNFWAEAKAPFQELTDIIMPQLEKGFARAGTEVGKFWGQLGGDIAKRITGDGSLGRMFDDLGDSIEVARGGTKAWANTITILGERGTALLPRLAQYFVDISTRFDRFLTKAAADGSLDRWIETGITNLKELGNVAYEAGRILGGLARAASEAGGTSLAMLADHLKDIGDVVQGEAFQRDLVGVLVAAGEAMDRIADISGPALSSLFHTLAQTSQSVFADMGETIGTFLGTVATALGRDGFQSGIINLFDGLRVAVDNLSPAFSPMADALGGILTLAGEMGKAFSPALAEVLTILSDAVIILAPALGGIVQDLSGPVTSLLTALADPIDRIVKAAGPALGAIGDGVGALVSHLTPTVGKVADHLADFLVDVLEQVSAEDMIALGTAVADMASAVLELVDAFILGGDLGEKINFAQGAQNTATQLTELGNGISDFTEKLNGLETWLDTHENASQTGSRWNQWIRDNFGAGDSDFVEELRTWFTNLNTQITEWFDPLSVTTSWGQKLRAGMIEVAKNLWDGFKQGLDEGWATFQTNWSDYWTTVIDFVKDILGIHSPSTVFAEIGSNIIAGLIQGIGAKAGDVLTRLGELKTAIGNKFSDAATYLVGKGSSLISGLRSGIASVAETVTSRVGELKSAILSRFSDAGSYLAGKGRDLVSGLRNAISAGQGTVSSAASSLKGAVTSGIGSVGSLLYSAGSSVVSGFISGIRSMFWSVQSTLSSLTSMLPDWKGPVSTDRTILFDAGTLVIGGFIRGLESQYDAVKDSLGGLSKDLAKTEFASPEMDISVSKDVKRGVSASLRDDDNTSGSDAGAAEARIFMPITVNNPVNEPLSVTTTRTLREAQGLGVLGRSDS